MNANPETQHKVLILGNQEVGKTAIVNSVSFIQTFEIKGKPRNNTPRQPHRDKSHCNAISPGDIGSTETLLLYLKQMKLRGSER